MPPPLFYSAHTIRPQSPYCSMLQVLVEHSGQPVVGVQLAGYMSVSDIVRNVVGCQMGCDRWLTLANYPLASCDRGTNEILTPRHRLAESIPTAQSKMHDPPQ